MDYSFRYSQQSPEGPTAIRQGGIDKHNIDQKNLIDQNNIDEVGNSSHFAPLAVGSKRIHSSDKNVVNVLLTLARPAPATLAGLNRAERYRSLMAHAQEQLRLLERWVREQHLSAEIFRFGEANCFHLLFVVCTPNAAQQLASAPDVLDVAVSR
ncbi:MAG: hypothetical protein R2932_20510 [Caldilineaceae bacterium]